MQMILVKLSESVHSLARRWISIVAFGLILFATYDRVASQEATPTPDVSTVPRLEDIFTPTSTPLPVAAPIVTATPVNPLPTVLPTTESTAPSDNQGNDGANPENSTTGPSSPTLPQTNATPASRTTATTETNIAQPATTVVEQTSTTLSLVAQLDREYLWPSQTFTLYISLKNLGAQPLTDVHVQYALPPELALQEATAGALGTIQQGPPTAGDTILLITWPSLAAGEQTTATLMLQVMPQTPNGRLIDTQIVAGVASTVAITADIILVMPPAQLPQF